MRSLGTMSLCLVICAGNAAAQQTSLHPETGQECIKQVPAKHSSEQYANYRFENICPRWFTITLKFSSGRGQAAGIPKGTIANPSHQTLHCERAREDCSRFTWKYE